MALRSSIVRSWRFRLGVGLGLIFFAGVWLDHRGEDRFDQLLDPMLRERRLPGRQQEQVEQAVGDLLKSPTFHAVLRREWVESTELLARESRETTRWWTETEWQGKSMMMAYALSGLKRSEMAALGELGDENAEVFVGPMAERQARDLAHQQRIWAVVRRLWHPKAGIIVGSFSGLMKKELWQQGWLQSVATKFAVERFRRHHGHLPAALIELVPKFLAGVPTDPNDGLPLRYRVTPSGYVIYSVGLDGVDDGGQAEGIPDEGFEGPWSGDTAIETSTIVRPSTTP